MAKFGDGTLVLNLLLSDCVVRLLPNTVHVEFTMKAGIDVLYPNQTKIDSVIVFSLVSFCTKCAFSWELC